MGIVAAIAAACAMAACQGPVGATGATGETGATGAAGSAGATGPTVYLEDEEGTRFYSGSTISMGLVEWSDDGTADGIPQSRLKDLSLVNETGGTVSFANADPNKRVHFVDAYCVHVYPPASNWVTYTEVESEISEIDVSTQIDPGVAAITDRGSVPFALVLTGSPAIYDGEIKKRYLIMLEDEEGELQNLAFEVYGVVMC